MSSWFSFLFCVLRPANHKSLETIWPQTPSSSFLSMLWQTDICNTSQKNPVENASSGKKMTFYESLRVFYWKYQSQTTDFDNPNYRLFERIPLVYGTLNICSLTVIKGIQNYGKFRKRYLLVHVWWALFLQHWQINTSSKRPTSVSHTQHTTSSSISIERSP